MSGRLRLAALAALGCALAIAAPAAAASPEFAKGMVVGWSTIVGASGAPPVGSVLTCATHGLTSPSYQWTRDGVNISGATSATYTTVSADSTHLVRCKATGSALSGAITVAAAGGGGASLQFFFPDGLNLIQAAATF